jgi:Multimeric flavodoxin WrbA
VTLKAIAINCTLKRSGGEPSSTDKMIKLLTGELQKHDVEVTETVRIADHDIKPGVTSDEGPGDAWPDIRRRILDCDILIFGTPIWLGQPPASPSAWSSGWMPSSARPTSAGDAELRQSRGDRDRRQ